MTKTLSFTKFRESSNYVLDLMNQGFEVKIVFGKGKKAKTIRLAEDEKIKKQSPFEYLKNSKEFQNYQPVKEFKNMSYGEMMTQMGKDKYGL